MNRKARRALLAGAVVIALWQGPESLRIAARGLRGPAPAAHGSALALAPALPAPAPSAPPSASGAVEPRELVAEARPSRR